MTTTASFEPDALLSAINARAVKNTSTAIGFELAEPIIPRKFKADIGLELELEATADVPLPGDGHLAKISGSKSGAGWTSVADGSLRGNAREYILNQPVYADELPGMVEGLFKVLADNKVTLDLSNRCSTHVHVNVQGLKLNSLTSIILLWSVYEQAIINWCGEERKTNHFCLSFRDSPAVITAWRNMLRGRGHDPLRGRNLKYSALNVCPLFDRGSFEFRCGSGADNPTYATQYALLCYTLLQYAIKTYEDPRRVAYDLSERGAVAILRDIFSSGDKKFLTDELFRSIVGNDDIKFEADCMDGFRNAQALAFQVDWAVLLEEITKPFVPDPFGKKKKSLEDYAVAPEPPRLRIPPTPAFRAFGERADEDNNTFVGSRYFENINRIVVQSQRYVDNGLRRVEPREAPRAYGLTEIAHLFTPATFDRVNEIRDVQILIDGYYYVYNRDTRTFRFA